MLQELDVIVFLKSHDDLEGTAQRVFGVLRSPFQRVTPKEGDDYFEASGLGFQGALFTNAGDNYDPEFEEYQYGLEITSRFWCVELDTIDLEGPLSEYYARQLAFELDMETATEIPVETTETAEIFEIRAYRRNPQYRLDQAPTTPKVFVVEARQVEEAFDEEDAEWEEGEWDEAEGEDLGNEESVER